MWSWNHQMSFTVFHSCFGWNCEVVSKVNLARILEVKHLKLLRWWRYLQTLNNESSSPNLRVSKTCILFIIQDVIQYQVHTKFIGVAWWLLLSDSLFFKLCPTINSAKWLLVNSNKSATYDTAHGRIVKCFRVQLMFMTWMTVELGICVHCSLLAGEQGSKLKWP